MPFPPVLTVRPPRRFLVLLTLLLAGLATVPGQAQSLLTRKGETAMTTLDRVAATAMSEAQAATVARTPSGYFWLQSWVLSTTADPSSWGSTGLGTLSDAALTAPDANTVVVAARKTDGGLGLSSWTSHPYLGFDHKADAAAGAISAVAVATVHQDRVVTATLGGSGHLKLIVWDLDPTTRAFTRRGDADAGEATLGSVVALDATRLVAVQRQPNGLLLVSGWTVSSSGDLTLLSTLTGSAIAEVAVVNTALDRAVTAARLANGNLEVAAWDLDANGALTAASRAEAGTVSGVSVAPLGSTRVVTAVRQADGTLKLIAWQVVDQVKRLDSYAAGAIQQPSIVSLGWDRLLTPLILGDGTTLKVIAWQNRSVGVLRGETGPSFAVLAKPGELLEDDEEEAKEAAGATGAMAPSLATRTVIPADPPAGSTEGPGNIEGSLPSSSSPAPALSWVSDIDGVDPMIAVGHQFVVATQDHAIAFYDKAGNLLTDSGGSPYLISSGMFFQALWRPDDNNGRPNRNNINRHLRFPLSDHPEMQCDPTLAAPVKPCMTEVYDLRVVYYNAPSGTSRFVIVGQVRHSVWLGDLASDGTPLDPIVRRFVAVAVSKTADPRDGFYEYMFTESNYSDWPLVAVNPHERLLVLAHRAGKNVDEQKPMAYVFALDDLVQGLPEPRNFKFYPPQTNGGSIWPVMQYGETLGRTYFVKPNGSQLDLYSFPWTLNLFTNPPALDLTSVTIKGALQRLNTAPVFRNSRIHVAAGSIITEHVVDGPIRRNSVRVVRVPLLLGGNGKPLASSAPADGFLDFFFGGRAYRESSNMQVSYEVPALAVNKNGDMLIGYGRVTSSGYPWVFPEARYSLFYNDNRGLQRSQLLRAGEYLPTFVPSGETALEAIPYYHDFGTDQSGKQFDDFSAAAVDPSDDLTLWMTHEFASTSYSGLRMVIGKVVP